MLKISVKSRVEHVKIVVVGQTFSWESVPQSIGSREKAVRVKPTSQRLILEVN